MATTIQVSQSVRKELESMKEYPRQTYNEVIEMLVSIYETVAENKELRDDVLAEIKEARKELKAGKGISTKQLLKELGASA